MDETIKKLYEILKQIEPDTTVKYEELKPETNIKNDLGLNSIGFLYLVIGVEKEFCITMRNADLDELQTLGQVVQYIEENA
ncbi:MAG: phosphopantetheine-binding protein [Bacilli bacterium]|nr:phosphopantetheine-binding protein [Bacilli bacterium]